jgi:hypothetical protein
MSTIEQQKEREEKFNELVELLVKICQCDKPCKVEADYDGSKFLTPHVRASLKAADWNPTLQEKRLPGGITVESVKTILHRKH